MNLYTWRSYVALLVIPYMVGSFNITGRKSLFFSLIIIVAFIS